jgi:hypothetical protein
MNTGIKSATQLLLLCIIAAGCSQPKISKSVPYVICPGYGISNYVAIGMTRARIKSFAKDMVVINKDNPDITYVGIIPSVGAKFAGKNNNPIGSIEFCVQSSSNYPDFKFNGVLACGLSFDSGSIVNRENIVKIYGEPDGVSDTGTGGADVAYLRSGKSYSMKCPYNRELLVYQRNGITFDLTKDVVTRIIVTPPWTEATGAMFEH